MLNASLSALREKRLSPLGDSREGTFRLLSPTSPARDSRSPRNAQAARAWCKLLYVVKLLPPHLSAWDAVLPCQSRK